MIYIIIICVSVFVPSVCAKELDDFDSVWADFKNACIRGDSEAVGRSCGVDIVNWLKGKKIGTFLGEGWKAESIEVRRKIRIVPFGNFESAVMLILEVGEGGQTTHQVMWWYHHQKWKAVNLPFEMTLLPPSIKYPTPVINVK
ncbi:MAG: hypothetical protein JNJ82_04445 [Opitutaceae bacterium]|nr:hypothetical protein [Opitutaceae bacterium]